MYYPSQKEFLKFTAAGAKGNLVPVYKEILADLETPVSAYFKLAQNSPYSFLLESVEGEEKVARYSFLARDPELLFESKNGTAKMVRFKDGQALTDNQSVTRTPLSFIRDLMAKYRLIPMPGLPRFCGGMVGYIGYDVVRFFEKLPVQTTDDLNLPDTFFVLAKNLVIFDHLNHKIKVVSCVEFDANSSQDEKIRNFEKAISAIDGIISELIKPWERRPSPQFKEEEIPVTSNVTEADFVGIVKEAKKKIKAGDIIQVVLSQRFQVSVKTNPFNIYRTLRALNPSPYMYYLNFGDLQIVGSSPELLVRCEDDVVETRPIAGTRPRGANEKKDAQLAKSLLNDSKEKAEHVMLVDLGRNDLGRVCQKGSVKVSEFMKIEKYSHVMHLVSNITGTLERKKDSLDVLEACFPAGTVSGAPKIRAMEIIEDLEKVRRGPYAGAIGYFSFSGNLDTCITIRTIVVSKGKAYVQAGAGIVADSVPRKEYQETMNKAKAQMMAIKIAHTQIM